ncbi:hypothetical protein CJ030_MR1G006295 [Morella rubra]|uniref:Uncharacterized protein n=1 Tax=Morella rubra TaxID=262757 RepID=A0A6A1WQ02_9ROSI|nr:hypothetical protein CJ030_MR1G006295 [Morella rubra]
MTRKRFRTIQSTNIGSSSSQPPTSRIASSSHQATPPIDAVSQAAPSTPIGISSEQPTKRFVIPEGPMGDVVKRRFFKDLGEKWRNHKCALKERHFDEARTPQEVKSRAPSNVNLDQFYNLVDFWFSATGRDRSQRGKQSRSLQTSLHTGGSRSFARHAYEMVNRDAQNVAHPEQVPSIPRSAHASTNDLGATLDVLDYNVLLAIRFRKRFRDSPCKIVSPPQGENLIFRDYIKAFIKDSMCIT